MAAQRHIQCAGTRGRRRTATLQSCVDRGAAVYQYVGRLVIARNSTFAYKGKNVDIRTIGRELGVGCVLEGSMRRVANRVRITAQLIDAGTGGHIWADRYDRDLTDIFAVTLRSWFGG